MRVIAGAVQLPLEAASEEKLCASVKLRGQGTCGLHREPGAVLMQAGATGFGLPEGGQPETVKLGAESYTLVFSGKIFNGEELRRELTDLGYEPGRSSDSRLVLYSYIAWGEGCTDRLNGVFAFAVWQSGAKRLFFARDRIGVKPLFYALPGEGLLFASEIKTLLEHPAVQPVLDARGAGQLVLLGPGHIPGSGIFRDIFELEPGCRGVFEGGRLRISRYWQLRDTVHRESFSETVEHVRWLLEDAVRRQKQSEVPMGALLSGGLDSSVLCALCARDDTLQTFCVDYEGNDRNFTPGKFQPNADGPYIDAMVHALGTVHRKTVLDAQTLADALESVVDARDLPGMGDIDASFLLLCRAVQPYAQMVLSGECADEIFGGYPWYTDPEVRSTVGFPWAQNTEMRGELMCGELSTKLDAREFVGALYEKTLAESHILPETDPENRRIKELVNLNFRWFMQTLLERSNCMSLAAGVEVRVPYCDYRIAEYLYSVPWEYKHVGGREKGLLRRAVGELLPEAVRTRKKSPYPKTFDPAFEALLYRRLREKLQKPDCPVYGIMDRAALEKLLSGELSQPWYGQLMRRPQLMAYLLQLEYWMRKYKVRPEW